MILVDLQKALEKMEKFLLRTQTLNDFYLKHELSVTIEDVFSDTGIINCGVPQGSILGLLLLLIYINDLKQTLTLPSPWRGLADLLSIFVSQICISHPIF